jgi:hypothetical protein
MKSTAHAAKKRISIHCEGSPGPGLDWTRAIEFRPLSRGFSVWVFEESSIVDRPRWRKRGSVGTPLHWRAAAAYLVADDDLRVFGDLWSSVSITGVPSWVADVLRCIVVEGDDPFDYRAIGELLLGFSDDEIVETLSAIGSIPARARAEAPEALAIVETRAKTAREQKLSAHTSAASTTPAAHDGATFVPDVVVERLAMLRNKTDDAQRIWAALIKTPLPEAPLLHAALVERWLGAPAKPRIDCKVGEINSEWPVLTWLLGRGEQTRALLETLAREHSEQATDFVEAVMKRGKAEAERIGDREGGPWPGVLCGIRKGRVRLALHVQTEADALGIPIDDAYRIEEPSLFN